MNNKNLLRRFTGTVLNSFRSSSNVEVRSVHLISTISNSNLCIVDGTPRWWIVEILLKRTRNEIATSTNLRDLIM